MPVVVLVDRFAATVLQREVTVLDIQLALEPDPKRIELSRLSKEDHNSKARHKPKVLELGNHIHSIHVHIDIPGLNVCQDIFHEKCCNFSQ